MTIVRIALALSLGLVCVVGQSAQAAQAYVDPTIASDCSNYSTASRSCGGGSEFAYSTFSAGLSAVSGGDTLYLRGGSYGQLNISKSGSPGNPITIRGMANEVATITTGSQVGLWVINQTDVVIADLVVTNVQGFGRLEDSSRISISNVQFSNAGASGTTGSLKFVRSTLNRVSNSSFEDGSDLFVLQDDSDRNVLVNNAFNEASHSLISIRCSSENVIRGNVFNNPSQKAMELYDCEGTSDAPVRLDDARRNLIEWNRFEGTAGSDAPHRYNGIQHGGQESIVRFNVYRDNLGGGVNFQEYSDASLYVYRNRLFNNTFYNNRCYGIIGQSGPSSRFYDNRVVNNLLYQNVNCSGGGGQVSIENSSLVIMTNNTEASSDPGFINAAGGDFSLQVNSPEIDNGVFVASTVGAGNGTSVQLDDVGWFYDGYGIAGEQGDLIRFEGTDMAVQVLDVDYATGLVMLESSITWTNGQGVHLAFAGDAPETGAFEYTGDVVRPMPPGNLDSE